MSVVLWMSQRYYVVNRRRPWVRIICAKYVCKNFQAFAVAYLAASLVSSVEKRHVYAFVGQPVFLAPFPVISLSCPFAPCSAILAVDAFSLALLHDNLRPARLAFRFIHLRFSAFATQLYAVFMFVFPDRFAALAWPHKPPEHPFACVAILLCLPALFAFRGVC